jgi:hypothetical protein
MGARDALDELADLFGEGSDDEEDAPRPRKRMDVRSAAPVLGAPPPQKQARKRDDDANDADDPLLALADCCGPPAVPSTSGRVVGGSLFSSSSRPRPSGAPLGGAPRASGGGGGVRQALLGRGAFVCGLCIAAQVAHSHILLVSTGPRNGGTFWEAKGS